MPFRFIKRKSETPATPSHLTATATAFLLLFFFALIAVYVWLTWMARQSDLTAARVSTTNMTQALAQHASDGIKKADTVLVGLVDRIESKPITQRSLSTLHMLLQKQVRELPELNGIFIYDADGHWMVNSLDASPPGANNYDRDYFRYHRDHTSRMPYIGPPLRSRSSGDWIITVSRRLDHPDGSFAGVALATVSMDYFMDFYSGFDIGREGSIVLTLLDGTVLARRPFEVSLIGTNPLRASPMIVAARTRPTGSSESVSPIDGVTRIFSYSKVDGFPLIAITALSKGEVLAEWRSDAVIYGLMLGLIDIALALVGMRLIRQIKLTVNAETEAIKARDALEKLNATLKALAHQDGLTGLANRRQFDLTLQEEFSRATRGASKLALILLDVDYFKQFNDLYGHLAGDECLRAIGRVVKQYQSRPGDLAARYGGEELGVVLPATDIEGAVAVAERILEGVRALGIVHAGNPRGTVSISAGVHAMVPEHPDHTPEEIVMAADRALYAAKQAGRDRVEVSST